VTVSIRALCPDDIPVVVESSCRAEGNRVWVAEADGRPVGYTVVVVHPINRETESGEISMVAVDPDYQQRGVGIALVDFALDRITELGIPLAEIGTGGDPGHAPARRLYERAGFTPVPLVRYFKALP
jgi:GNAT superfamily N-acetyltransferase